LGGGVEPALARADWCLGLDDDQRDAVDQQDEVRTLLRGSRTDGVLRADDVLVPFEVLEVDEADGNVLAVSAEGHRAVAAQPGRELLIRPDEPVGPDAHQDGAQPVQHVVCPLWLRPDLRIQPNQSFAELAFDEDLLWQTAEILWREEVPA